MASNKLMKFYKQIHPNLNIIYATTVLEKAFYPVIVGMLGSAYLPECVFVEHFNAKLDLGELKTNAHRLDPYAGEYMSDYDEDEENEHEVREVYTEWDIQEI